MSLVEATRTCLKKYADFTGRARRSEFWWFYLASTLAVLAVYVVGLVLAGIAGAVSDTAGSIVGVLFLIVYLALALALFVPFLAVSARRLHDTDKSGWFYLLGLIPFVGGIIMIVLWATEGTAGPNRFGASPKGVAPYGGPAGGFDQGYGYPTQA